MRTIGNLSIDRRQVPFSSSDVAFLRTKDKHNGLLAWSGHQTDHFHPTILRDYRELHGLDVSAVNECREMLRIVSRYHQSRDDMPVCNNATVEKPIHVSIPILIVNGRQVGLRKWKSSQLLNLVRNKR